MIDMQTKLLEDEKFEAGVAGMGSSEEIPIWARQMQEILEGAMTQLESKCDMLTGKG